MVISDKTVQVPKYLGGGRYHVSELVFCVSEGQKCMSFNLEMMEVQMINRMMCNISDVPNFVVKQDSFTMNQFERWTKAEAYLLHYLIP